MTIITEEGNYEDQEEGMTAEERQQLGERVGNMLYEDEDFVVQKKPVTGQKAAVITQVNQS